jgi:hypothetical protein
MYKTITTEGVNGVTQQHIIIDNGDGSFTSFPVDNTNQTYLKWVAEGNTAEPADEVNNNG